MQRIWIGYLQRDRWQITIFCVRAPLENIWRRSTQEKITRKKGTRYICGNSEIPSATASAFLVSRIAILFPLCLISKMENWKPSRRNVLNIDGSSKKILPDYAKCMEISIRGTFYSPTV